MQCKKQKVERIVDSFVQENPTNELSNNESHNILELLPPGYRFRPTEEELVMAYLRRKIMNQPMPPNKIMDADVYQCHPLQLSREYESYGEQEWYFFSPRDRRYPKGNKPKRSAQNGYWKSTGTKHSILSNGNVVGNWRTMVFYEGDRPSCKKTNWIMREYVLNEPTHQRSNIGDMKLDDWVLCRIYKNEKNYNNSTTEQNNHEESDETLNQEVNESIDSSNTKCGREYINGIFPELFEPHNQDFELLSQIPPLQEIPQDQLQYNTYNIVADTRPNDHTISDKPPSPKDITPNLSTFPKMECSRLMIEPFNYIPTSQEDMYSRITSSEMSQHCHNNIVATTMGPELTMVEPREFTNPPDQHCNPENLIGTGLENLENFGLSPVNPLYYDNFDEPLIPWDEI